MAQPRTQVALAVLGLLGVAAVGALVLPAPASFEPHQLPIGGGCQPTVAAPIEVQGCIATGQVSRVRVFSPVNQGLTLVQIDTGPGGTQVRVLESFALQTASGLGLPIVVVGDVTRDEVVTFTLTAPGQPSHWVRVDRSTAPATVTLSPSLTQDGKLPGTIQPPVAWRGEPTNPQEVSVYDMNHKVDPADAANATVWADALVFRYQDNGNGTSTITHRDPRAASIDDPLLKTKLTSITVPHDLLLIEGSPLTASFKVTVRPAGLVDPTSFTVSLQAVRAALAGAGVDPDTYLVVVRDVFHDTQAYKAAHDGNRTLDAANLTGQRFLNGQLPHKLWVDVRKDKDLGAPTLLVDSKVPVPGEATVQQVATRRLSEAGSYVRYEGLVPQAWLQGLSEGATVHFAIAYRTTVAKLVTEQLIDDNQGQAYRYRVDNAAPGAPTVQVSVPDPAKPAVLRVTWNATDASSGVASYRVEKARVASGQPTWEPWIQGTAQSVADFTGDADKTYRFRVRATDNVGLEGLPGQSADHSIPGGPGGATNSAPTVQLLQPTGGEAFENTPSVLVAWRASDPDGTVPVINLYRSRDGGATWETLASPTGTQYTWDISQLPAGDDYRVKVEATDGSLASQDTSGKFRVDNTDLGTVMSIGGPNGQAELPPEQEPPVLPPAPGQEPQGPLPRPVDPMLIIAVALLLIAAAAGVAVWQWRARR